MEGINLLNVDVKHGNEKKTKNVMEFIRKLEHSKDTTIVDQKKFDAIRREALSKMTADEMLEVIGYKLSGEHKIFEA